MAPWNWDRGGVGGNYDDRVQRCIFCFWRMRSTAAPPGWGCHCHGNCGTEFTSLSPVTVHQCVCVCVCVLLYLIFMRRFRCSWKNIFFENVGRCCQSSFLQRYFGNRASEGFLRNHLVCSSVSLPSRSTRLSMSLNVILHASLDGVNP